MWHVCVYKMHRQQAHTHWHHHHSHFGSNGIKRNENKHNKCVNAGYVRSNVCACTIDCKEEEEEEKKVAHLQIGRLFCGFSTAKQTNKHSNSINKKFEKKEWNKKNCDSLLFSSFTLMLSNDILDDIVGVVFLHACVWCCQTHKYQQISWSRYK